VPIGAEAIVRTGGGGGWGDPLERDPERVAEDVAEALVSAAAARKLYGVVLRRDGALDQRATNESRERLRSARAASPKRSARPKTAGKKPTRTPTRKRGR
jgi:N-methylhydantoinase B